MGFPPGTWSPVRPGCRKRGRVGRDLPHGWVGTERWTEGGRGSGPPTSKLSTLMGERGSRISASSFLWRLAPAPSPGTSSGAPGIFPVGGGRLMPPPGPHSRCPRSGPAASGPSAAPEPPAPGGAPPGPAAASSSGCGSQRRSGAWGCPRGRPGPARAAGSRRRRPRPSVRFAPPGPLVRRELAPSGSESASGEAASPPRGPGAPPAAAPGGCSPAQTATAAASPRP